MGREKGSKGRGKERGRVGGEEKGRDVYRDEDHP